MVKQILCLSVGFLVCTVSATEIEPTWESMAANYNVPEWFQDGKIGVWTHWGIPSAVDENRPNDGSHYGRRMYGTKDYWSPKGSKADLEMTEVLTEWHTKRYGHPSEVGYEDLIPMFKAEKWDPDALVTFFKENGARFIMPVATHHDNFDMYDSFFPWNSVKMGPKRDTLKEWKAPARKHGLKFGVSTHLYWSPRFFKSARKYQKPGTPEWTFFNMDYKPIGFESQDNWNEHWYARCWDLIEKYDPDMFNNDSPYPQIGRGKGLGIKLFTNYVNRDLKENDGKQTVVLSFKDSKKDKAAFTQEDIRFTSKGDTLYAFVLAKPTSDIEIKTLAQGGVYDGDIGTISLLGSGETLTWERSAEALTIKLPETLPDHPVVGFRILNADAVADKKTQPQARAARTAKRSKYLETGGQRKLEVLYKQASGKDLYLDLYYPTVNQAEKCPVIVFTHGGGWAAGNRYKVSNRAFGPVFQQLIKEGFAVAPVSYRLARKDSNVAMRDCVIDCKDAIRFLAQNSESLGIDPMRFYVMGDSAGGHIAQMLLLSSPESLPGDPGLAGISYRMVAGVSWYGPCDFEKTSLFNHDDRPDFKDRFGPRILGSDSGPQDKLARFREMSPINYLTQTSPPLLMIQGDKDTTIPVKHAYYMQEKAKALKAPVEIMIIKNAGHNWRKVDADIEPSRAVINERTVQFFVDHL